MIKKQVAFFVVQFALFVFLIFDKIKQTIAITPLPIIIIVAFVSLSTHSIKTNPIATAKTKINIFASKFLDSFSIVNLLKICSFTNNNNCDFLKINCYKKTLGI